MEVKTLNHSLPDISLVGLHPRMEQMEAGRYKSTSSIFLPTYTSTSSLLLPAYPAPSPAPPTRPTPPGRMSQALTSHICPLHCGSKVTVNGRHLCDLALCSQTLATNNECLPSCRQEFVSSHTSFGGQGSSNSLNHFLTLNNCPLDDVLKLFVSWLQIHCLNGPWQIHYFTGVSLNNGGDSGTEGYFYTLTYYYKQLGQGAALSRTKAKVIYFPTNNQFVIFKQGSGQLITTL